MKTPKNKDVVGKMESLARKWHEGQYRKGPERTPYIEHPKAVVGQLKEWGYSEKNEPAILAIAWGHDLLEDTSVTVDELLAVCGEFGPKVLDGIESLTFRPEKWPEAETKEEAKAQYLVHLANFAENDVFAVKLADRLCNLRDFSKLHGVGSEKMHSYYREAKRLFDNLGRMGDRRSAVFKTVSEVWKLAYPDVAMPRGYTVGYQSLQQPETIDMANHLDEYPPELSDFLLEWREKANALYGQWVGRYYIKNAAAYFRYKERDYCLYPFAFGDGSNEFFEDLFLCYGMQEALLELGAIEVFYSGMMD